MERPNYPGRGIRPGKAVVGGTGVGHTLLEQVRGSASNLQVRLVQPEQQREACNVPAMLLPQDVELA